MGATSNPNAARLAALQDRKKAIEESLAERNNELKQLCIQVCRIIHLKDIQYVCFLIGGGINGHYATGNSTGTRGIASIIPKTCWYCIPIISKFDQ